MTAHTIHGFIVIGALAGYIALHAAILCRIADQRNTKGDPTE